MIIRCEVPFTNWRAECNEWCWLSTGIQECKGDGKMSASKETKQREFGKMRGPAATASRKSDRKLPGTRAGTIEDWRAGGTKKAGEKSGRGKGLRDGQ
jgi:hypothetical protein